VRRRRAPSSHISNETYSEPNGREDPRRLVSTAVTWRVSRYYLKRLAGSVRHTHAHILDFVWDYQIGFTFLMPAHPGSPGQNPRGPYNSCVLCVVCVCFKTMTTDTFLQVVKFIDCMLMLFVDANDHQIDWSDEH